MEKLSTHPVRDYAEIQAKLDAGLKSRSVASTDMNATSRLVYAFFLNFLMVVCLENTD